MTAMGRPAKLRVCASCEWIFKESVNIKSCPKCGFAHYSAFYVFGKKCYRYAITQKPWMEKKLDTYRLDLLSEIDKTNPIRKKTIHSIS
jgi:hypothetical protein